jgi:RNA polymerase sigma factor (sigma-70 family)
MTDEQIAAAYPAMLAVARRNLRNRTDAEDAVQSALLMAWRYRETFEGRSSLKTWLCTIVKNKCSDRLRSWQRHPHVHFNMDWVPKQELTTEEKLLTSEITEMAWVEMSRLPAELRLPLVTVVSGNEQLKQVAVDTGIGYENLKGRADRGRKFLRIRMQKYL